MSTDTYPVRFSVDYPDRPLDRVSTLFRIFAAIPIAIVLASVAGGSERAAAAAGGALVAGPALMLVFRRRYPRWWFDWNLELSRFSSRVAAYLALLDDRYPSTEDHQSVHLDFPYPNAATELSQWLPLVKWFLAIPHYVVLCFLGIGAFGAVVIAWFAILLTGGYPRSLFDYVVGVMRWSVRVGAYAFLLVTDRYPPFRLDD